MVAELLVKATAFVVEKSDLVASGLLDAMTAVELAELDSLAVRTAAEAGLPAGLPRSSYSDERVPLRQCSAAKRFAAAGFPLHQYPGLVA